MNHWDQIRERLRDGLSAQSYRNWLEPVSFDSFGDDGEIRLVAPNAHVQTWVESELNSRILLAARGLGLDATAISVAIAQPEPLPYQQSLDFGTTTTQFKPEYTFSRFVVGACNEFAHAASLAVANKPATSYNPLFVYSDSGMGKTHLLNAIGHHVQQATPQMKIVLTTAEDFLNEMVKSIRYNNMQTFHQRFRQADALLVDDVHVLAKKERTQEEFFHTFNALYHRGKQIVLTSDCDPKRIPGLVGRLKSRFSAGLMADIQAPDLETKMAILDRKTHEANVVLPDAVRTFVATLVHSNVRELEGVVNQIVARSRFVNGKITLGMVKSMFSSLPAEKPVGPSIAAIQEAVAANYGLNASDLVSLDRSRPICHPRHVAMYLAKKLTNSSLTEIGNAFKKHHSTVLHGVARIQKAIQNDNDLRTTIDNLINMITSNTVPKIDPKIH